MTTANITDDQALKSLLHETKRVLDIDESDHRAGALLDRVEAIGDRDEKRNLRKATVRAEELRSGMDEENYQRIFSRYLRRGIVELDQAERQILARKKASWALAQASGPSFRAQGTTSGPAGGYLVPQAFSNQLEESLKHYSAVRSVATVMTTETGRDMPWPTVDDTTQVGELLAENGIATEQDVAFGQIVFTSYKYSSKLTRVSRELVEDAGVDLQALLTSLFARRIGVLQNQHFTTGTGTGQPLGVVTGASLGKAGIAGQITSVIYDDLVDLLHSVDPLYRTGPNVAWMMADSTLKFIRELKDTAGKPTIEPTVGTLRNVLLGYPVIINPNMPVMAASAKSILFGDFSKYIVRDSLQLAVLRLQERYAEFGQVGFLAFMRSDGRTLDAGTDPIKFFQNSAT